MYHHFQGINRISLGTTRKIFSLWANFLKKLVGFQFLPDKLNGNNFIFIWVWQYDLILLKPTWLWTYNWIMADILRSIIDSVMAVDWFLLFNKTLTVSTENFYLLVTPRKKYVIPIHVQKRHATSCP